MPSAFPADIAAVRTLLALAICLAFVGTAAAWAPPAAGPAALVRVASKLSGLPAKRRVPVAYLTAAQFRARLRALRARDYPAARQAHDDALYRGLGLLQPGERLAPLIVARAGSGVGAVYDPVTKRIYARRGVARAQLLREIVRALNDQSFDLTRMTRGRLDRDAGLAALAAVEGNVVLATHLLAGARVATAPANTKATPRRRSIEIFLDLQAAFPGSTGVQFAATLHNVGGASVARGAVRRLPEATAQIFHVDAYLERRGAPPPPLVPAAGSFTLASHDTFGELDVRALLAVFAVPRLDRAANGWAGGRSGVYRDGAGREATVVTITWLSELDAAEWLEAAGTYVNEAFDAEGPGPPAALPCSATACWALADRVVAVRRAGVRTSLAIAPTVTAAQALAAF